MSEFRFNSVVMLLFLWVLPALALLFVLAARARRRAIARFADPAARERMVFSVNPVRRRLKAGLLLAAFALLTLGLARPQWNPSESKPRRHGRDVLFLLDVSKSMLARDLYPNRLERAKLAINDCVDRLQGDRVGLIAFAGTPVVMCPLTLDYGFFRLAVEDISAQAAPRGGTQIGDAIRKAMKVVFNESENKYRDIILITDGGDHESFPVEAAQRAGELGIRILAIGLGDKFEPRLIPIGSDSNIKFLQHEGENVTTMLDANLLQDIARATPGGGYLDVATGTMDLGEIYLTMVAAAEKQAFEGGRTTLYEDKFQLFVAAAFLLLCLETVVSERRKYNVNRPAQ